MPYDHYLPASYLALFSSNTKTMPLRYRRIFVRDKLTKKIFSSIAGKVGGTNNLYNIIDRAKDSRLVDNVWLGYETKLVEAINDLCEGKIDGETWARVLVPFVAGLLIRGPDFNKRFTGRLESLGFEKEHSAITRDTTNYARLFELQRLLAFVIAARWTLVFVRGQGNLLTNDLGFTPYANNYLGEKGIAVPLNKHAILTLSFLKERTIISSKDNCWFPIIQCADIKESEQYDFNNAIINNGIRYIFGSNEETLKSHKETISWKENGFILIDTLLPNDLTDRAYEFTWHRLVGALAKTPEHPQTWTFPLDFQAFENKWCPPVFLPTNLIEFPSTLKRIGNNIHINLYDTKIYYELIKIINLTEMGEYSKAIEVADKTLKTESVNNIRYDVLLQRSRAFTETNQFTEALLDIEEAINLDPTRPLGWTSKGYTLMQKGELENCLQAFSKAVEIDPTYTHALLFRSAVYEKFDNLENSLTDLSSLLNLLPDGQKKGEIYLSKGYIYSKLNNSREALENFTLAINFLINENDLAECYTALAKMLLLQKNSPDALSALNKAVELNPDKFEARIIRAHINFELKKYDDSLGDLLYSKDSLDKLDLFNDNSFLLAECYVELNRFSEAEYWFNKAVEDSNDKDRANFYHSLSILYQGKLQLATEKLNSLLTSKTYNDLSKLHIGIITFLQSKFNLSIDYLSNVSDRSITLRDKSVKNRNLALSYAAIGDHKKAKRVLKQVLMFEPDAIQTVFTQGRLCWYFLDFDNALKYFYQVKDLEPTCDNLDPYIGLTLIILGDIQQGNEILNSWKTSSPMLINLLSLKVDVNFLCSQLKDSPELINIIQEIERLINSDIQ